MYKAACLGETDFGGGSRCRSKMMGYITYFRFVSFGRFYTGYLLHRQHSEA